jgi:hypothetical protein
LRGLQKGLAAHVPVDVERIEECRVAFEQLALKAALRLEIAVAMAALQSGEAAKAGKALDTCAQLFVRVGIIPLI